MWGQKLVLKSQVPSSAKEEVIVEKWGRGQNWTLVSYENLLLYQLVI